MATINNTVNWALPILGFLPLTIGAGEEPALTNANIVQQTIVGPPFCWNWNRGTATFTTTAGQQDYTQSVTDFAFIEKASVTAGTDIKEIQVKNCLSLDSKSGRPDYISAQTDDGAGNITFRLMKVPDTTYTVTITYQKKVPTIASLASTWAIPDRYQYIYSFGFLTMALLHADDPRMPLFNQKFMSALLSASSGVTEMERNIFIGNWLALTRQETGNQIRTQQGQQARGM